ncbi:ATP-grasp domain-containing protein [bacterium]|nr:ATP-grasp domain-containing protein [bacterium]
MPCVLVVLPSSSYRGPDFVAAADRLGLPLLIASDGVVSPAWQLAGAATVDLDSPDAAAADLAGLGADHDIAGVVGVDDSGILVAALTADALGLPGNHPDAVRAAGDKALMRSRFAVADVPQPRFVLVDDAADVASAAAEIGFPVVVKPTRLSASRGVIRANDSGSAGAAALRVRAIMDEVGPGCEGPMLVEEFIPGAEIAIEAMLDSGGIETLAVFDKPDPLDGPFFEETIYTTPSRHDARLVEQALDAVADAAVALGLVHGPVHAEVRLGPAGPVVIELAARTIGGLCSRSLSFGMLGDVPLEELVIRAACGLPRRGMPPTGEATGVMMLPIPRAGVLGGVRGTEAAWEVPGVTGVEITVPRGRHIRPLPEGDRYLGFMFATGESAADVEGSLREGHACLEVVFED